MRGGEDNQKGILLDIVAFLLAWNAVFDMMGYSEDLEQKLEPHWRKSKRLLNKAQELLPDLLEEIVHPVLVESPRLKSLLSWYRKAAKPGRGIEQGLRQALFLRSLFYRMDQATLKKVFPNAKHRRVATQLAYSPSFSEMAVLQQMASIRPMATRIFRPWMVEALKLVDGDLIDLDDLDDDVYYGKPW